MSSNESRELNWKPTFSIICSLRKHYLCFFGELLEHLISQSYEYFECVLICDEHEIDWIKLPDKRFKLIHLSTERSLAEKRNIGLENCSGDYILFCDADDYLDVNILDFFAKVACEWAPDFILPKTTRSPQDLINQLEHQPSVGNLIVGNELIVEAFFSRYLFNFGDNTFLFDGSWGRAFKKTVIDKYTIRFFEKPCRAEDALFVNDFILKANSAYLASDYIGYFWRQNPKSEMFNVNSFFFNLVPFADKLSQQLSQVPTRYSKDINYYLSRLAVSQIRVFCNARNERKINKRTFNALLREMAPKNTFIFSSIKRVSLRYGVKIKIPCILYTTRFYSLLYRLYKKHL